MKGSIAYSLVLYIVKMRMFPDKTVIFPKLAAPYKPKYPSGVCFFELLALADSAIPLVGGIWP